MPKKKQSKPTEDAQSAPEPGSLSFVDGAEFIMKRGQGPFHYKKITDEVLAQSLVNTQGKTPENTMYVALKQDIQRRARTGEPQRFVFLGNGQFQLVERTLGGGTQKEKSAFEKVSESRAEACKLLYQKLTATNRGDDFELMVGDLLNKMGYEDVEVIGGKDDQGVDILCGKRDGITKTRLAVQCKCKSLQNQIGPKDVSNLRDNLSTYQCQQGIIVTTTRLNEAAKEKAAESGKIRIDYIEHDELLDLFAQHEVGLKAQKITYYQVDADQYDFLGGKDG